jgi:hypothetical protein
MELPSRGAASSSAIQEFHNILWNPNVHYCVQKYLSLVPIMTLVNPVHVKPFCFSKIYFNINRRDQ